MLNRSYGRGRVCVKLLKSGTIAKQIKEQIFDKVSMLAVHHFIPQLRILWIGDDSSSEWFINSKIKLAEKLRMQQLRERMK